MEGKNSTIAILSLIVLLLLGIVVAVNVYQVSQPPTATQTRAAGGSTSPVPCPKISSTAYDCTGKDLRGLNFRNMTMDGSKFGNAKIQYLDFTGASMKKTSWLGAYIDGAVSNGSFAAEDDYVTKMPRAKLCDIILPSGTGFSRSQDCGKLPGN